MSINNRRLVVGPRGGQVVMAVTCLTCISLRSCNPAPCTEPWGCESWTDMDKHRVVTGARATAREAGTAPACAAGQIELFKEA